MSAAAQDRFRAAYARAQQDLPTPDRVLDLRTSFGIVRLYRFDSDAADQVPMLLLPGRVSASPVWVDNLPSLRRQAPLYTFDLLGEPGLSIQDRPIRTAADQAQWLHEVLQQLPEPRLDLLGLSIGGWTAMNLVRHRPEKVRGVVLLEPVLVFAPLSGAVIFRSLPASLRWLPKAWRDDFASWTANDAPVADEPVAQVIEAGMQSYAMALPTPERPTEAQLTAVDRPVLVILAGASRMHDPAAAAATAERTLRSAQVLTYADASHAMNGEHPDRIAADVQRFRDQL